MEREKITLYEMWVGITLTNIFICLAVIWFVKEPLKWALGLLLGAVTAMVLSFHMMMSIRKSVSRGGDNRAFMGTAALIRVLIEIAVLVVAHFSPYTQMLACFVGIFTLKLAAYETPFIHQIALKLKIVEDPVYPEVSYDENGNLIEDDNLENGESDSKTENTATDNNSLVDDITNIL